MGQVQGGELNGEVEIETEMFAIADGRLDGEGAAVPFGWGMANMLLSFQPASPRVPLYLWVSGSKLGDHPFLVMA